MPDQILSVWQRATPLVVVPTMVLALCAVSASSCQSSAAARTPPACAAPTYDPTTAQTSPPAVSRIVGTAEVAGAAVLELPADSTTEPGAFYRVYSPDRGRAKGLIQITAVSTTRRLARVVALTDRGDRLSTGDRIELVSDLAELTAPGHSVALHASSSEPSAALIPAPERLKEPANVSAPPSDELSDLRVTVQRLTSELAIARLSASRAVAVERAAILSASAAAATATTTTLQALRSELTMVRSELVANAQRLAAAQADADAARAAYAAVVVAANSASAAHAVSSEQWLSNSELARIESERAWLELAARVLRARGADGLTAVQNLVRESATARLASGSLTGATLSEATLSDGTSTRAPVSP